MSARVRTTDVGGLRGEHEFVFSRGLLNIVEGSNSGGKSSVIQALAAVLSVPRDCDMSPSLSEEAIKLGVKTDPSNAQEGFVSVLAKKARVELDVGDKHSEYVVDAKGIAAKCPDGDPRFLMAGILSNRCKVIRQLRGQDAIEPDDFRWAVSELSLAKRYEEVLGVLISGRDEVRAQHELAKRKVKEHSDLTKEKTRLEKLLKPVEAQLSKLKDRFRGAEKTLKDLEGLSRKRDKARTDIARLSADLSRKKSELEQQSRERARKQKELTDICAEIDEIDIPVLETDLKRDRNSVEEETRRLISERDSLDGVLNLFVVAEASMGREGSKCPLCNRGALTHEEVQRRLDELRQKKEGLTSSISRKRQGLQQRTHELETRIDQMNRLVKERDEVSQDLKLLGQAHDVYASGLEEDLRLRTTELERLEQEIEKLSAFKDEEIRKAFKEKDEQYRQLFERIAVVKQSLYECIILIRTVPLGPDMALEVTQRWLSFYDLLIDFTKNMAEAQKVRAAELFNTAIKELLNKLDFGEFRTVMLNKEYRLYVERFDEKKRDYVFQQVRTLSTSEQMSIALILQMALKETYLPEVPFFLMDDIMEDFDDARRRVIVDYLRQEARDKDVLIVATKLVKGQQTLNIRLEGA